MHETPIFGMNPGGELQTIFFRANCRYLAESLFKERGSRFHELRPIRTWKEAFSTYITPFTEELLFPLEDQWCAYTNNGRGASHLQFALAHKLSIFAVRFAHVEWNAENGDRHFSMSVADGTAGEVIHRTVEVATDGGKLDFHEHGIPMAFEDKSRYASRRVKDRVDSSLLTQYASALGVKLLITDDLGPGYMIARRR